MARRKKKNKKKTTKKKTTKGKSKTLDEGRKPGSGRPAKYQDPVDKSIRMEREQWVELESMCPEYMARMGSWNDKMQVLLELARKGFAA